MVEATTQPKRPSPKEIQQKLQETEAQLKVYIDHLQRLQAEFENYRKRHERDQHELRQFLTRDLLGQLLDLADSFDRALAHLTEEDSHTQGLRLIHAQLTQLLAKHGVTPLPALHQPFNPHHHEALATEASDAPPQTIIEEIQKGYFLHGTILRPAKVKVSDGPSPNPSSPDTHGGPQQ